MQSTSSIHPQVEALPVARPGRRLAPVVAVEPSPMSQRQRRTDNWVLGVAVVMLSLFTAMFIAYVLEPAATTVTSTTTSGPGADGP
jgi:hypothetical protein